MLKQITLCMLTVILIAGPLHASGSPIIGTVSAVTDNVLTIRDKANKVVVIALTKRTKYFKDKQPATRADLKVGVRVVIDAVVDAKMKMLAAAEVKIEPANDAALKSPSRR